MPYHPADRCADAPHRDETPKEPPVQYAGRCQKRSSWFQISLVGQRYQNRTAPDCGPGSTIMFGRGLLGPTLVPTVVLGWLCRHTLHLLEGSRPVPCRYVGYG